MPLARVVKVEVEVGARRSVGLLGRGGEGVEVVAASWEG